MKLKIPALLTIASFLFVGCSSTDSRLDLVKNGMFDFCTQKTVNQMVNGYIANPNILFGGKCYENKPEITDDEQNHLDKGFKPPLTKQDKEINQKVHEYQQHLDSVVVSPFNYNSWSKIF